MAVVAIIGAPAAMDVAAPPINRAPSARLIGLTLL
jgi:hypothetical protein